MKAHGLRRDVLLLPVVLLYAGCGAPEATVGQRLTGSEAGVVDVVADSDAEESGWIEVSGAEPCNGLDDDEDGTVDEGCTCSANERSPCYGGQPIHAGHGACVYGWQECVVYGEVAAWGPCEAWVAPKPEQCGDYVDQNCDGLDPLCPKACGNQTCDPDETCEICPSDCGTCPGCELPGYGTLEHGQSVMAYASASVPCNAQCERRMISCFGGKLSGASSYIGTCSPLSCAVPIWPMARYDASASGRSVLLGPQTSNRRWEVVEDIVYSSLVGSDGSVYVLTSTDVAAYSDAGTLKWRHVTANPTSIALAQDERVYVIGVAGTLSILRPDGTLNRTIAGLAPGALTVGQDGTVYSGSKDGRVSAVDPATGTEKWDVQHAGCSSYNYFDAPAIGPDGSVYHGNCAYTGSGALKWKLDASQCLSPMLGTDGSVYVPCSGSNKLHALQSETGASKWSFDLSSCGIASNPALGADGTLYVGELCFHLRAISPIGVEKWSLDVGMQVQTPLVVGSDGTIYLAGGGGGNGSLAFAVTSSGAIKWKAPLAGRPFNAPSIGRNNTLFSSDGAGKFIAFGP